MISVIIVVISDIDNVGCRIDDVVSKSNIVVNMIEQTYHSDIKISRDLAARAQNNRCASNIRHQTASTMATAVDAAARQLSALV